MERKRLFIAMPFGARLGALDFTKPLDHVEIDFNGVWKGVLTPAIPEEFEAKRADQFRSPGIIDLSYVEWLYDADVVLADLTFGNANVYYELGIRQALSMKGTVLVMCKGTRLPFDVRNQRVIQYDYFHAPSLPDFHDDLKASIVAAAQQVKASPVHIFLPGLRVSRSDTVEDLDSVLDDLRDRLGQLQEDMKNQGAPQEERRILHKLGQTKSPSALLRLQRRVNQLQEPSLELLEDLGVRLRKYGRFEEAITVLERALESAPDDVDLLREIGFCYRRKGPEHFAKAKEYWAAALRLDGEDAELLGMVGGMLKRSGNLRESSSHYEKAHQVDPANIYPLVALGAISVALENLGDARQWYQQLEDICTAVVEAGEDDHWTHLCLGEAAVFAGKETEARQGYGRAIEMGAPPEDLVSAFEQLEFLQQNGISEDIARNILGAFASVNPPAEDSSD